MNKHGMLGIIIALSIAMIGGTIVVSYGGLQVEAAKSGSSIQWCYKSGAQATPICFPNHGECNNAQASDRTAESSCFKKKTDF